jgi:hypothetical protein
MLLAWDFSICVCLAIHALEPGGALLEEEVNHENGQLSPNKPKRLSKKAKQYIFFIFCSLCCLRLGLSYCLLKDSPQGNPLNNI